MVLRKFIFSYEMCTYAIYQSWLIINTLFSQWMSHLLYIIVHRINIKMNYLLNSSMLKNTYSPLSIMLSSSAANSISLTVNGSAHTTITETESSSENLNHHDWKSASGLYVYNEMLLLLSKRVGCSLLLKNVYLVYLKIVRI